MANSGFVEDEPDAGGISVLINNGDATFAPEVKYQVGPETFEVVLADADGDGVLDAITQNHDFDGAVRDQISVLAGNGDGTFDLDPDPQPISSLIIGSWGEGYMDAGDVDGDGDIDLAVGGVSSQADAILKNDGTGEFTATTYDLFGALSVTLVDADDDDDLDLISVGGGGGTEGSFMVQRNNGDGTLAEPEIGITSNNPLGLASATSTATAGSTWRSRTATRRPGRRTCSARTARSRRRRPATAGTRRTTSRPVTSTATPTWT